tara:strand:- start:204 stop:605 length:402 start_codon:yes stop_codon:yes gene_type:complete
MKFEANIPSYLRTGQGVFPVKGRTATKADTDTPEDANFFELMKKGANMPVANEIKDTQSVQLGSAGMNEPLDVEGFLEPMQEKMQKFKPRMEIEPKIDPKFGTDPVMPQIQPQILKKPDQLEAKAEDADIIIS